MCDQCGNFDEHTDGNPLGIPEYQPGPLLLLAIPQRRITDAQRLEENYGEFVLTFQPRRQIIGRSRHFNYVTQFAHTVQKWVILKSNQRINVTNTNRIVEHD